MKHWNHRIRFPLKAPGGESFPGVFLRHTLVAREKHFSNILPDIYMLLYVNFTPDVYNALV